VGRTIGDYHEFLLGQDISYALHHLQLWAEFYEVRFQVPRVGDADTFAYFLEGKYKFTPQLFAAMRWNQQLFSTIPDGTGGSTRWGHDLWRVDTSVAYRFTAHTQLKLQYSFQDANSDSRELAHTLAAQFTLRF
jgi:predicted porin